MINRTLNLELAVFCLKQKASTKWLSITAFFGNKLFAHRYFTCLLFFWKIHNFHFFLCSKNLPLSSKGCYATFIIFFLQSLKKQWTRVPLCKSKKCHTAGSTTGWHQTYQSTQCIVSNKLSPLLLGISLGWP